MPASGQTKHLFFDLDDTIWDFQANSSRVLQDLFTEHGLENKIKCSFNEFLREYKDINLEFWSLYSKRLMNKQDLRNRRFADTFARFGYENETENRILTEKYMSRAPQGKALKPGALEVLTELGQRHYLHLLTNGFIEVQDTKIDGCGLRQYFRQIIISEKHGLSKPDTRLFRLAEELSGAQSTDCVMIGDNEETDIHGALSAGWEAVHLSNGIPIHKHTIRELKELLRIY
ncbi:MAG TPA: YjjG family noncanonical pyrimidine nucleotidase [Bacteroidia bacterium]|nr:YjjG family noncanonical pyrimidine nucleotidase [Bacteroidia bacterium]